MSWNGPSSAKPVSELKVIQGDVNDTVVIDTVVSNRSAGQMEMQ